MSFFKCSKNLMKIFFFNFEVSLSIVGLCQRSPSSCEFSLQICLLKPSQFLIYDVFFNFF